MEVPESVPSWSEQDCLLVNELNQNGVNLIKQRNYDAGHLRNFSSGFQVRLPSRSQGHKKSTFCFLEVSLMDMIHQGTLGTILMKSSDLVSYLVAFISTLVEKLNWHPAVARDPAELTGRIIDVRMENGVKKMDENVTDPLKSKTESSSKTSDNNSMARGGSHHRNNEKMK